MRSLHDIQADLRETLKSAKAITEKAKANDRGMSSVEHDEFQAFMSKADGLEAEAAKAKAADVKSRLDGAEPNGWKVIAKAISSGMGEIDNARGVKQSVSLKSLTDSIDNDLESRVQQGISVLPSDQRFIYGLIEGADAGDSLYVSDFRLTARSVTAEGGVERDPRGTTAKARLNATIDSFTEPIKQLAILADGIPNAVIAALPQVTAVLQSEMQKSLNVALDAHVLAAINAASPETATSGDSVEAAVRSAITHMTDDGLNPDVVVLNPVDAATVDLHTFETKVTAFPFGLKVVTSNDAGQGSPLVLDTTQLGVLYKGSAQAASDPYNGVGGANFAENLCDLRLEFNTLMVVRQSKAAVFADIEGS